jgi:hypothetical protein
MVWIKRNIFFVISAVVGLLLTGYCAVLLFKSLKENAGVSEEYRTAKDAFDAIRQKSPYPSKENIQAAKVDQERVRKFMADFRKRFEPFPAPPVKDEKGFKTYLEETLVRFRAEATNAGVLLPADFGFAFPGMMGKLTYPPGNIGPWMQQLEEINDILDILFRAKINYLSDLERVPVSLDDIGASLKAASLTNQWQIVTPYKITFRGFSAEIAAVMEGFARSSHCFIVKAIDVSPDTSVQPLVVSAPPPAPAVVYAPRPSYPNPAQSPNPAFNRTRGAPGSPWMRSAPAPVAAAPVAAAPVAPVAVAAAPAVVTILSENPLLVTLSIDVVKLKASEH